MDVARAMHRACSNRHRDHTHRHKQEAHSHLYSTRRTRTALRCLGSTAWSTGHGCGGGSGAVGSSSTA